MNITIFNANCRVDRMVNIFSLYIVAYMLICQFKGELKVTWCDLIQNIIRF